MPYRASHKPVTQSVTVTQGKHTISIHIPINSITLAIQLFIHWIISAFAGCWPIHSIIQLCYRSIWAIALEFVSLFVVADFHTLQLFFFFAGELVRTSTSTGQHIFTNFSEINSSQRCSDNANTNPTLDPCELRPDSSSSGSRFERACGCVLEFHS